MVGKPETWSFELSALPSFADGIIAVSLLLMAAALLYVYRRRGESDPRATSDPRASWPVTLGILAIVAVALVDAASALSTVLTASRTTSIDEFLKRFSARLYAIGSSHDLLIADDWHGASLRTLVEQQLESHAEGFGTRIAIEGEDIILKPEAVHN